MNLREGSVCRLRLYSGPAGINYSIRSIGGVEMEWRLGDAKRRFSELVRRALADGPQFVRRRHDAVVVLSEREYRELAGERSSLKRLLLDEPDLSQLDLERDGSPLRPVRSTA